jgi:hypothetical protein
LHSKRPLLLNLGVRMVLYILDIDYLPERANWFALKSALRLLIVESTHWKIQNK